MEELPDIETYLRNKALEMYLSPPQPRSPNHLGYMTFIFQGGDTSWGELSTDEKHETREQYEAWAVETAASIPTPENLLAMGFSYDVMRLVHLFRIVPQFVVCETCSVSVDGIPGEWKLSPLKDAFARALWAAISD